MKLLKFGCAIAVACSGIVACAPTPVAKDYGTSVRQMIAEQTADPGAESKAGAAPVKGEDPAVIEQSLKAMRTEKVDRAKVAQPMAIDLGGQGNP